MYTLAACRGQPRLSMAAVYTWSVCGWCHNWSATGGGDKGGPTMAATIGPGGPAMADSHAINGPPGLTMAAIIGPQRGD